MARSAREGRLAFLVAAVLCGILLYLVNRDPGWRQFGLVTSAAEPVVPLVNASLVVALVVCLLSVFADLPRLRALAGVVLAGLGVWIAFRLLVIFPFAVGDGVSFGSLLIRILLAFGMIGGIVVIIVSAGRILRG